MVGAAGGTFEEYLAVLFFDGENGRGVRGVKGTVGGVATAFGFNIGEF